jgi:RNA polymerase sigma-70 factor, ECF subfamily
MDRCLIARPGPVMLNASGSDEECPDVHSTAEATIPGSVTDKRNLPAVPTTGATGRGDRDALVGVIESCRSYLLLVAERALSPDLRAKEAASDLVQEVMVEAQREAGRWTGRAEATDDLRAWLRQFLLHKIAHLARRYRATDKRRIAREVPLATVEADTALAERLVADQTSPCGRAAQHEEEAALRTALDRLSERMRRAVLWRHHEDCSFDEIGRRLGCSNVAARKLWLKALQKLQVELKAGGDRRT